MNVYRSEVRVDVEPTDLAMPVGALIGGLVVGGVLFA